jgi:ATP-dependent HslUV protease ATP-binding subunit HslU
VSEEPGLEELSPRQIVAALDQHVVGQKAAKRAVAIALRNRWRRQQLPAELAEDVMPRNILMIGPTGVGKTEIARRLARLARVPLVKVEASKFTEVGYVGRDVESIVRDLVEAAYALVRDERRKSVEEGARGRVEDRLLEALLPARGAETPTMDDTRSKLLAKLRAGALDDREVEIEIDETPPGLEMLGGQGFEQMGVDLGQLAPALFGSRKRRQRLRLADAREVLLGQEVDHLLDRQQLAREARQRAESGGIVFLDEIDKICAREDGRGPDVSREGVQRDLLPIVEGTTVATKYGPVRTDHVLFIAAGAFHVARPSDLIPELQGRFPLRVELAPLTEADYVRILTEPNSAITKQYAALLATEGVSVVFRDDAIAELARLAVEVNSRTENIGARRLATLVERLLEEVSFEAPAMAGVEVVLDAAAVRAALADLVADQDLSRYVL